MLLFSIGNYRGKTMLNIEQIVKLLGDRNLREVSRRSKVSYSSIRNLLAGRTAKFNLENLQKLSDYLSK